MTKKYSDRVKQYWTSICKFFDISMVEGFCAKELKLMNVGGNDKFMKEIKPICEVQFFMWVSIESFQKYQQLWERQEVDARVRRWYLAMELDQQ